MANKNKTAENREESAGSRISTKKFYFTDGGASRTPAPTIPGVVPMSKQKNNAESAGKENSGKADKQSSGKNGKKKENKSVSAEAASSVKETKSEKNTGKQKDVSTAGKAKGKSGKNTEVKAEKMAETKPDGEAVQKANGKAEKHPDGKPKGKSDKNTEVKADGKAGKKSGGKAKKNAQDKSANAAKDGAKTDKGKSGKKSAKDKQNKPTKESRDAAVPVHSGKIAGETDGDVGEQDTAMQRRKQKSGRRAPEYARQNRKNRRVYTSDGEDALIECKFSYSGSGYGFGEQLDGNEEDIFISPRATMDAMTGDIVQVRITGSGRRGGQSAEGEVVAVTEHNVSSIVGTLLVTDDGVYHVIPDNEKLRTPVYVPAKDVETLGIGGNTKVEVIPDGMPYFVRSRNIAVQRRDSHDRRGKKGRRTEKREDTPFFELMGRISAVFGDAASREANYAAILHESGIRTEFPAYVTKAADNASAEVLTSAGRRDIRDRIIFTIDGAGAKDLDDAISLEKTDDGYILGVHIADVSHYAPFGSCIEGEARLRGTSVYFTDKVVPMLPKALSNHACSLNAESDKYALSCEITLDKAGNRVNTVVYKSRLQSTIRGVYEEVNDLLDKGEASAFADKYRTVADVLTDMRELYRILAARSEARGVMELESAEPEILLDETGFPVAIVPRVRGDAEKMIEQFMLQANMAVGELLNGLGLPCLYRIHDEPDGEKIKTFALFAHNLGLSVGDLTDYSGSDTEKRRLSEKLSGVLAQAKEKGIGEIVSSVLLRSMMKAKYVSVCSPHFGLGVPVYCHFTSPIRRYPDLFVHNVLSAVLPYAPEEVLTPATVLPPEAFPKQLAAECAACGISSTETEIAAQNAEWKIEDLYMALYMSAHIGEMFDVTVDSVIRQGIFVRCDNLAEGMLPASAIPDARLDPERMSFRWNGETYGLGSRMQLRLTEADAASGRITFGI
ncbi:MAG: VacB/RNase II family 3'-5' exoribonuclease [Ruminococcaceae bacterium]|nr:VacB/RNase II family 3'-5' exoribonuclease [Oscillospiraceae bacterium]